MGDGGCFTPTSDNDCLLQEDDMLPLDEALAVIEAPEEPLATPSTYDNTTAIPFPSDPPEEQEQEPVKYIRTTDRHSNGPGPSFEIPPEVFELDESDMGPHLQRTWLSACLF